MTTWNVKSTNARDNESYPLYHLISDDGRIVPNMRHSEVYDWLYSNCLGSDVVTENGECPRTIADCVVSDLDRAKVNAGEMEENDYWLLHGSDKTCRFYLPGLDDDELAALRRYAKLRWNR